MSKILKVIQISEKIKKCHETAQNIHGKDFYTNMKTYNDLIVAAMKKHKVDALVASMKLIEESTCTEESGIFSLNLLSAYYEFHGRS